MIISASTTVCGSLARPNKSTTAPIMHNAGFEALSLDYRWFAFEPDDIGRAMDAVRTLGFAGVSVSKPFKQLVAPHLDELDPVAQSIGAVNLVHNVDGRLVGYNSDWIGAMDALKEHCELTGRRVAVLGAGGAARAVVFGLLQNGCDVTVFNRSEPNAQSLVNDMGGSFGGGFDRVAGSHPDVLINATPISHGSDDVPISDEVFSTAKTVMDIVVRPTPSRLLERAHGAGADTIDGVRMLVLQGAFTFEKFTGTPAPVEVMQVAVVDALAARLTT